MLRLRLNYTSDMKRFLSDVFSTLDEVVFKDIVRHLRFSMLPKLGLHSSAHGNHGLNEVLEHRREGTPH